MTPLEIARYRLKNAELGAAIAATELHRAKLAVLQCEDEEAAKWDVASSSSQTNSSPASETE